MEQSIVKNLKWLGDDGTVLTAGNSGKIPPGQVKGPGNEAENSQFYYHPDHLGSTSYITDITGEVYQHLEYFAFGETFVEEHSNTHHTPYKFNGKELDEETGLYYYGARYYEPKMSVFQSVDRFAEKYPNISPYAYVANNPVKYIDPTGDTIVVNNVGKIMRNDKTDNLVYMSGEDGSMKSLGELGGNIKADEIYTNLLEQNMSESKDIVSPWTFKSNVTDRGKWDLKLDEESIFGLANGTDTKFSFEGKSMTSEDIGNHHFGAVALAYGWFPSEEFILKRAGKNQIDKGRSKPEWQIYKEVQKVQFSKTGNPYFFKEKVLVAPYGDDPNDQKWIKAGFQYYKINK